MAGSAIASVLIARSLGPTLYGTYAGLVRLAALALSVCSLSFGHGLAQYAASATPDELRGLWRGSLRVGGLAGATAIVVLLTLSRALDLDSSAMYIFFAFSVPPTFLLLFAQHLMRGMGDLVGFSTNRSLQPVVWCGIIGIAYLMDELSVSSIGVAWAISQYTVSGVAILRLRARSIAAKPATPIIRRPLIFGLRSHVGIVGRDMTSYMDQVVLLAISGAAILGLYAPAATFAGIVLAVGVAVSLTIQPEVARSSLAERPVVVWVSVLRALRYSIPAAVVCFSSAKYLVPALYGPAFAGSVRVAEILCLGVVLDVIAMAVVAVCLGLDRPALASWLQGGSSAVLVGCIAFGVYLNGAEGAAWGASTAYLASALAGMGLLIRISPLPRGTGGVVVKSALRGSRV